MALGNEIEALKAIEKEIDALRGKLKGSHEDLLAISKAAREAQGSFMDIKLPKELQKSLQANQTFLDQLNAQLKERERLEKALQSAMAKRSQAESNINKELLKHRLETNLINAAMRDEAVLASKLTGAYQKLGVQHKNAAKNLRNIVAEGKRADETQRKYNVRLKQAQKEFDVLDKRIRKADVSTRNFSRNVGNYQSALGKASVAFRNFAGIFGVYSGLQIAREIYGQVKALDAADKALRQVTQTTEDYNRAQSFVKSLAEEAGSEIIGLTQSYTKFLASARTTNLTARETENIFRQVAKAAGILGLTTEDTNGAFRALEQILSKGKVQAEEIRGQLGERLPGAFQILARSMGLTTAELDKQLELGNVLSEKVLPGFAEELERAYSLDLVQRVETLASEQNRLSNAWTEFIRGVEGGEGILTKVLSDVLKIITASIKGFTFLTQSTEQLNDAFNEKLVAESYTRELEAMQGAAEETGKSLLEIARLNQGDYLNSFNLSKSRVESLKDEIEKLTKAGENDRASRRKNAKRIKELNEELESETYTLSILKGRLDAVNHVLEENSKVVDENTDATKKLNKARQKLKELSTISFGTTIDEAKKFRKEAEAIAESLAGTKLGDGQTVQFGVDAANVPDPNEINNYLKRDVERFKKAQQDKTKALKISAEEQQKIFDQLFSTFSSYYGLDLNSFSKLIGGKKVEIEDFANTAKSISNAIFENQLINYENEIVANQERLDAILADETATEETKKQAKLEADRKEKEIRLKQAKAERNNVLIQIGIDTAAAVAKVLAQTGVVAPFVIPGIIALGAAQAAFVASQPLPKFKDGVRNFDGGPAIINDQKGGSFKELVETPDGKFFMSNKRNVVANLPKGSNVYTAEDTKAILNNNSLSESERIDLAVMRMGFEMFGGLEDKIENGIEKGFKKARITNNIKNVVQQPTTSFF